MRPPFASSRWLGGSAGLSLLGLALVGAPVDDTRERSLRLPDTDANYKRARLYVEETPDSDYRHASVAAHEAFRDLKFGIRIHWGLYSISGKGNESWPFLGLSDAQRQAYQQLYRTWNPQGFNAEEWVGLFARAGARCFAFTAKHHDGFSLFDTRTRVRQRVNWTASGGPQIEACDLAYSIRETPFRRDIVRELSAAARRHGLKIDLYFSHPDWYDADFRPWGFHPLQRPGAPDAEAVAGRRPGTMTNSAPPSSAEEQRMIARHREQLRELLTNYGPIDMVCLDISLGARVWPELKATIKELRALQPDVMFRARGIGNYGDYYTPEGFVPGAPENTALPWMVIHPLGRAFSYESEAAKHKGAAWIVRNLIDAVAKGGNFMVGIGPDGNGRFHPTAVAQLEEVGAWLRINGEAIYGTRPREGSGWGEGDLIRYTRATDGRTVYALVSRWPEGGVILKSVAPRAGSTIRLLGHPGELKWRQLPDGGVLIASPDEWAESGAGRTEPLAHAIRIEVDTSDGAPDPSRERPAGVR